MIWNSDTLVLRLFGIEDDVATGLVNLPVAPLRDQRSGETATTEVSREFHAVGKISLRTKCVGGSVSAWDRRVLRSVVVADRHLRGWHLQTTETARHLRPMAIDSYWHGENIEPFG